MVSAAADRRFRIRFARWLGHASEKRAARHVAPVMNSLIEQRDRARAIAAALEQQLAEIERLALAAIYGDDCDVDLAHDIYFNVLHPEEEQ